MRYVLDTNVVPAPHVRGRNPQVEAWAASMPVTDQFVTATTMAEIERGVVAKEQSDPLKARSCAGGLRIASCRRSPYGCCRSTYRRANPGHLSSPRTCSA